jgi:ubiquinone biosynthesis protein Coq4
LKYSNDSTLGVARQQYFARSGFDERGYADKWVQLKAGPISFYFPNTQARVRAVKLHDLHHVLTEYDTNWRGEAEIGAWEIASGCGRYLAAWALNLGAFGLGLALAPRRVYRAFLRGRQTGNLYSGEFAEWLLSKRVGEIRSELRLDRSPAEPSWRDRTAFTCWAVVAAVTFAGPCLLALALAALGIRGWAA